MKRTLGFFVGASLVLAGLVSSSFVSAHGALFTYKYIDGETLVMVTHNVHDPVSDAPITYNLRLYTVGGELVSFEKVHAEVKRNERVLHEQSVSAVGNGDTNFTYTYPDRGNYVLDFTFIDHGKQIARGEFPVSVADGIDENWFGGLWSTQALAAFVLGIGAAVVFSQRRRLVTFRKKK